MSRCLLSSSILAPAMVALAVVAAPVQAQVQRNFPANALRGEIAVVAPPQITLNGAAAQLAPGARIRGDNNLLVMSGAVTGQKFTVNYTVDFLGLVMDVWILRAEEVSKFWPRTKVQAAQYTFDPIAQTWTER